MSKGNQDHAAAAAAIKERLDFLLEGKCVGTGTPLSAAVATALEVDRRRAPSNDRISLGHSDEQLLKLAADIYKDDICRFLALVEVSAICYSNMKLCGVPDEEALRLVFDYEALSRELRSRTLAAAINSTPVPQNPRHTN